MKQEFMVGTSKKWAVQDKVLMYGSNNIYFKEIVNIEMKTVSNKGGVIIVELFDKKKIVLNFLNDDIQRAYAVVKYISQNRLSIVNNDPSLECSIEECLKQFGVSSNDKGEGKKRKISFGKNKMKEILIGLLFAILALFGIVAAFVVLSRGDSGFIMCIIIGILFAIPARAFLISGITRSEKELQEEKKMIKDITSRMGWEYKNKYFYVDGKTIHVSEVDFYNVEVALYKWQSSKGSIHCKNGKTYYFSIEPSRLEEAIKIRTKFALDKVSCGNNNKPYDPVKAAEDRDKLVATLTTDPALNPKKKDASVVKRAVVGGIIAGEAGAVVGALSAIDENNKNKK